MWVWRAFSVSQAAARPARYPRACSFLSWGAGGSPRVWVWAARPIMANSLSAGWLHREAFTGGTVKQVGLGRVMDVSTTRK